MPAVEWSGGVAGPVAGAEGAEGAVAEAEEGHFWRTKFRKTGEREGETRRIRET